MFKIRPKAGRAAIIAVSLLAAPALALPAHATTGPAADDDTRAAIAKIVIGDHQRGCTGTLIDPSWLLTAASCFANDPADGLNVPGGKPELDTTALFRATDTSAGELRNVVELVPRNDRDVVLARLSRPVANTAPIPLSTTAPAAGEELTVAGYGRTKDEWAPLKPHTGAFTVGSATATETDIAGSDGAAVCMGDTGGPALRQVGGTNELAAVNSRSQQGGCFGTDDAETGTGAVSSRVDDLAPWVREAVEEPPISDFNCDGAEDTAVSDPDATVGGDAKAGLVRISYGGGKVDEIHQDLAGTPGGAESGDRFGEAMAVLDHDEDGCSDLVVGIPQEDIGTTKDAGMVSILYGSPEGLTKGKASLNLEQGKGEGAIAAAASETGDKMGSALAAGTTALGEPYLVIGVPGEALGDLKEAGNAYYLRGKTNVAINQNKTGIAGTAETGDRWGASVAASPSHVTIGVPGEAVGPLTDSGAIQILSHAVNSNGIPTPVKGLHQDTDLVNGAAEVDDRFGEAVTMVEHRPDASSHSAESILAVGSPGEALGAIKEAGRVVTFKVTGTGTVSQIADISQDKSDVTGKAEEGDLFGQQVTAVSTAPLDASTPANTLLAVGAPGEDIQNVADAGTIQTFPLLGPPGDADISVEPGKVGLPGTPGTGEKLGSSIHATSTHLYVGMPHGPAPYGAVHSVPWPNITADAQNEVTTFEPGKNGLPAVGETFGSVTR